MKMRILALIVGSWLVADLGHTAPFSYEPAGVLVPGSGAGLKSSKVYAPTMRYPILNAPSYPNSQVWGVGGSQGPKGGQCDAKNFSYPWHDNYCETRTWAMPLCPAGKGHQGQDIRAATCENKKHPTAAAEDGTITSIGTYTVYLKGQSGTTYRYGHMDPPTLKVKVGQKVSKGEVLGFVSNSFGGTPTSVHLHFDVIQYIDGVGTVYVSPYNSLVEAYKKLIAVGDLCATKNCDDGSVCTKDACLNGNCSHAAVAGPCDDGDACTLADSCQGGNCAPGGTKPCDDNNACTTDSCSGGNCQFANNANACSDKNPCTEGDQCSGGACKPGAAKSCDDGVACSQDLCDNGTCKNPPLPGTCDDGNPCTQDTCDSTGCKHAAQGCDDGNPCTQDACTGGACSHTPTTGGCEDGDPCTTGDICGKGLCSGVAKNCDDESACTADSCLAGACVHEPHGGSCDDGDACTEGDYCAQGLCLSGMTKTCDDGLDCTEDSCVSGNCAHAGATQAPQTTCQGTLFVESYDECGGGPTMQECPPDQPCAAGNCGGSAAQTVDAGAEVTLTDAAVPTTPAVGGNQSSANPSGCQSLPVGAGPQEWAALALLAGVLVRRCLPWRRSGRQQERKLSGP